jgi:hypothetical protein
MSLQSDNLIRIKILLELDRKTNNQAYYLGEGNLADWLMPVTELLARFNIGREDYIRVQQLLLERDEIGFLEKNKTEYIFLKEKGLIALYGRSNVKTRLSQKLILIPSYIKALTNRLHH